MLRVEAVPNSHDWIVKGRMFDRELTVHRGDLFDCLRWTADARRERGAVQSCERAEARSIMTDTNRASAQPIERMPNRSLHS